MEGQGQEQQNAAVASTDHVSQTTNQPVAPVSSVPVGGGGKANKKWIIVVIVLAVLLAGGAAAFFFLGKKSDLNTTTQPSQSQELADGGENADDAAAESIDCEEGYSSFADSEFGVAFCYPSEWGTASVKDAKLAEEDTGYRQIISFSRNEQFTVGGVSDDWTTVVGRGGSCLEPSNTPLDLSAYNTEWHDVTEEFAQRSLEASVGGYDMTETVGSFLGGVCATGHKIIEGSRYRVVSVSYFNSFTSGVASAADHMEDPYILFRETERFNLDKVLATLKAY